MSIFFQNLLESIPSSKILLDLEPKALAGFFLLSIVKREEIIPCSIVTADSLSHAISKDLIDKYPKECHDEVLFALMEAWQWLVNTGLVAPRPHHLSGRNTTIYHDTPYFITRLGQSIKTYEDFKDQFPS